MTQTFEPPVSDESAPFWDATRDKQLLLPWCTACARPFWYPRAGCPQCLGSEIEWRPASGTAVVYASVVHYLPGPGRDRDDLPYVVALVELPEGVRMMTNIVDCAPEAVTVGMSVNVSWKALSDGRHLPVYAPA
jgi:uncharacterized OB-fold protein